MRRQFDGLTINTTPDGGKKKHALDKEQEGLVAPITVLGALEIEWLKAQKQETHNALIDHLKAGDTTASTPPIVAIRDVGADGNCFYYATMFGYLESKIALDDTNNSTTTLTELKQQYRANFKGMLDTISPYTGDKNDGPKQLAQFCTPEEFDAFIDEIIAKTSKSDKIALLAQAFNYQSEVPSLAKSLVAHLRYQMVQAISKISDSSSVVPDEDRERISAMQREADGEIEFRLAAKALNINLFITTLQPNRKHAAKTYKSESTSTEQANVAIIQNVEGSHVYYGQTQAVHEKLADARNDVKGMPHTDNPENAKYDATLIIGEKEHFTKVQKATAIKTAILGELTTDPDALRTIQAEITAVASKAAAEALAQFKSSEALKNLLLKLKWINIGEDDLTVTFLEDTPVADTTDADATKLQAALNSLQNVILQKNSIDRQFPSATASSSDPIAQDQKELLELTQPIFEKMILNQGEQFEATKLSFKKDSSTNTMTYAYGNASITKAGNTIRTEGFQDNVAAMFLLFERQAQLAKDGKRKKPIFRIDKPKLSPTDFEARMEKAFELNPDARKFVTIHYTDSDDVQFTEMKSHTPEQLDQLITAKNFSELTRRVENKDFVDDKDGLVKVLKAAYGYLDADSKHKIDWENLINLCMEEEYAGENHDDVIAALSEVAKDAKRKPHFYSFSESGQFVYLKGLIDNPNEDALEILKTFDGATNNLFKPLMEYAIAQQKEAVVNALLKNRAFEKKDYKALLQRAIDVLDNNAEETKNIVKAIWTCAMNDSSIEKQFTKAVIEEFLENGAFFTLFRNGSLEVGDNETVNRQLLDLACTYDAVKMADLLLDNTDPALQHLKLAAKNGHVQTLTKLLGKDLKLETLTTVFKKYTNINSRNTLVFATDGILDKLLPSSSPNISETDFEAIKFVVDQILSTPQESIDIENQKITIDGKFEIGFERIQQLIIATARVIVTGDPSAKFSMMDKLAKLADSIPALVSHEVLEAIKTMEPSTTRGPKEELISCRNFLIFMSAAIKSQNRTGSPTTTETDSGDELQTSEELQPGKDMSLALIPLLMGACSRELSEINLFRKPDEKVVKAAKGLAENSYTLFKASNLQEAKQIYSGIRDTAAGVDFPQKLRVSVTEPFKNQFDSLVDSLVQPAR